MEKSLEYVRYRGKHWINTGRKDRNGYVFLRGISDRSMGVSADPKYVYPDRKEDVEALERSSESLARQVLKITA